jgi:hypothetical protein
MVLNKTKTRIHLHKIAQLRVLSNSILDFGNISSPLLGVNIGTLKSPIHVKLKLGFFPELTHPTNLGYETKSKKFINIRECI